MVQVDGFSRCRLSRSGVTKTCARDHVRTDSLLGVPTPPTRQLDDHVSGREAPTPAAGHEGSGCVEHLLAAAAYLSGEMPQQRRSDEGHD